MRHRTAAIAVVAALAMAGCGSGTPGQTTPGETGAEEAPETTSPLSAYYQAIGGSDEEGEAEAQQREIEDIIAACMAEAGFSYLPLDPADNGSRSYSADDLDVPWGSREFAETYGYGVTTDPYGIEAQQEAEYLGEVEPWVDPNQEYVDAMSDSEREAYHETLNGPARDYQEGAVVEYDWTTAGCWGRATHEVYDRENPWTDPDHAALIEELNSLYEARERDPRVAEALASWSSCMADAGYPGMTGEYDPENQIQQLSNEIGNALWADLLASGDYTTDEEFVSSPAYQRWVTEMRERIAVVTEAEIAMAVADYDCRAEAGVGETRVAVQAELEQAFIDANQAELDAWVAAWTVDNGH